MVWPIMGNACRRSIHLKDGVEASQRVRSSGEARRAVHLRLTSNPETVPARSRLPGSWKLRWRWPPTAGESRSTRELRCGEHAWAGAAEKRSRRIVIAENRSSTALVGCLRTVGSALAATATTGAVDQHWLSWVLERSAHLVAGNPDWASVFARGPRRSEYPPKSSPRCAG